ncbi:MAG: hypothetical protein QW678_01800 [Candidatus Aenigmatarchaeota archaeon]
MNKNITTLFILILFLISFLFISFSEETSIMLELDLKKGWNLISIPFSNYLIKENNCKIKNIYSYNSIRKTF